MTKVPTTPLYKMYRVTTHPASPPLKSDVAQVAASHPHSGRAQSCSRHILTKAHVPWRMVTPSPGGPADLDSIQGSSGRPVCLPLAVVLFPDPDTCVQIFGTSMCGSWMGCSRPTRSATGGGRHYHFQVSL